MSLTVPTGYSSLTIASPQGTFDITAILNLFPPSAVGLLRLARRGGYWLAVASDTPTEITEPICSYGVLSSTTALKGILTY